MNHCALLHAGEIQSIIGDASRNGVGGQQYCGVWSLTSRHRVFNAFGNSYAGLIPDDIRGRNPVLEQVDDRTAVLTRKADDARPIKLLDEPGARTCTHCPADEPWPIEARAEYRLTSPYYIDHVFSFTDKRDVRLPGCDFREVLWCSYINCPDDSRMHYLSNGAWHRYVSPAHGVASSIAPSYVPAGELEKWPIKSDWRPKRLDDRPFNWDRYKHSFDEPFFYGRLAQSDCQAPMVLIMMFDSPRWLRLFCSPTGGGYSLLPGKSCPAWDFEWVIPSSAYAVGKTYSLRMRLIYKLFVSDDDVLAEVRKCQAELGFEPAHANL